LGVATAAALLGCFVSGAQYKRAEQALRGQLETVKAEKEWYARVLDSIDEEVYFTDTAQRYTYANPAVFREFGYSSVDGVPLEQIVSGLVVLRPDGTPRPLAEAPPLRALKGETVRDEEQLVLTPRTGRLRHRRVRATPVRDAGGNIIGSVSVVHDITEFKRVEASLREADERKNVFLSTLSHELRNPLAPIRTAAHLLTSPLLSQEDARRCCGIISRQVAHVAALLEDLLDLSKLTRGGELTLRKERVPLQDILSAAIESVQPFIAAKRQKLHTDTAPELPAIEVDAARITQVISNLLTNAVKYTHDGGDITLAAHLTPDALVIAVQDNGIGIPPDMHEHVFDMFVQLEPAAPYTADGSGIGLALVKNIVELHGGRVTVESGGLNRGSTFKVMLPRDRVFAVERTVTTAATNTEHSSQTELLSVLIADDNIDGAEVLSMFLRVVGHTVHVAHDGIAAFADAARIKPDIVVLDIGMPGLNGYEVAARIRAEPWGRNTTLIAITGWGQEADKRKAAAAGFDHHFTKPIDPQRLGSVFPIRRR